jgi:hypothetical protein
MAGRLRERNVLKQYNCVTISPPLAAWSIEELGDVT